MNMTCGRARRLLWPDAGPRPASPDVIDAQRHLVTCAACQRFLTEVRGVGEVIHELAPREQAPAEVRERLFATLARARAGMQPHRRSHARYGLLLAGAVLVVILGATLLGHRLTRQHAVDTIAALAEEHARGFGETRIVSADPSKVEAWLSGQVHFGVRVPSLPGASLRGARISVFDGRRGAVMEYDVAGTPMSYFVIPNEPEVPVARESMRFDHAARAGYQVVSWREPGLLHAMVGTLSPSQLLTLAKACVEQFGGGVA